MGSPCVVPGRSSGDGSLLSVHLVSVPTTLVSVSVYRVCHLWPSPLTPVLGTAGAPNRVATSSPAPVLPTAHLSPTPAHLPPTPFRELGGRLGKDVSVDVDVSTRTFQDRPLSSPQNAETTGC